MVSKTEDWDLLWILCWGSQGSFRKRHAALIKRAVNFKLMVWHQEKQSLDKISKNGCYGDP